MSDFIPNCVKRHIFSYLSPAGRSIVQFVCKDWYLATAIPGDNGIFYPIPLSRDGMFANIELVKWAITYARHPVDLNLSRALIRDADLLTVMWANVTFKWSEWDFAKLYKAAALANDFYKFQYLVHSIGAAPYCHLSIGKRGIREDIDWYIKHVMHIEPGREVEDVDGMSDLLWGVEVSGNLELLDYYAMTYYFDWSPGKGAMKYGRLDVFEHIVKNPAIYGELEPTEYESCAAEDYKSVGALDIMIRYGVLDSAGVYGNIVSSGHYTMLEDLYKFGHPLPEDIYEDIVGAHYRIKKLNWLLSIGHPVSVNFVRKCMSRGDIKILTWYILQGGYVDRNLLPLARASLSPDEYELLVRTMDAADIAEQQGLLPKDVATMDLC